ncbi:DNA polymerase III subunit gamma/tau [Candidatus Omnitrophota bacterium]
MSYQVFAQKYRPQKFDDVIGQEAVTRTLKNSVIHGRLANAYIFCGPRGVGKTSVARLLAKTLNCEVPPEKSPCNLCSSCREISQGNNIDVLEIDGASNRGIDEIRTLRENVKFSPSKGKYKVYIIDEVHMLTQEAFNALLKTLEEPPAHVKFVFATTAPHKVLPTIMSRCQRFDFKKIPPKMIHDRVMEIAKKEKIVIDEKAALLISRSADGSLRDSLVILDQMVSFSGKEILPDDVIELLGMVHKDRIFELSDAVIDNDPGRVTRILDELINSGKDPVFVTNGLISHYRDLMILKTTGAPTSDMAFAADELEKLTQQLGKLSLEEILYILQNLSHCLTLMKGTMFARAPLEVALIRISKRKDVFSLAEVLAKLERLEKGYRSPSGDLPRPDAQAARSVSAEHVQPDIKKDVLSSQSQPVRDYTAEGDNKEFEPMDAGFEPDRFHWEAILNYIKNKKMSVFTFLNTAKPVEFGKNKMVIGFGKDHAFNKEALEANNNKSVIEEAVNKVTGKSMRVEFTLLEFLGESAEKSADEAKQKVKMTKAMKPVIEKAMDVFGGNVVRDFVEDEK